MADGAYEAAVRQGREQSIRFFGTDALSGESYGLESVLEGRLSATFIYPTGGDEVVHTAMNILTGKPFEREMNLNTSVVDSTTAPIMHLQMAHIATLDRKIETLTGRVARYLERYATQRGVLFGSLAGLLVVIALLVAVYRLLRLKSRKNRELLQQKAMLEEQKQALQTQKDQLERLSHELEEATHAKLVFFTNISHDFRTPLTLIADPVDQLLADASVKDTTRQLLELVKKNVGVLLRLVNQILDFRKVENGRMELHLAPFDLRAGLLAWNDSFRVTMARRRIRFSFRVEGDADFRLMADAEKMERIYFNLLSNALKYTPEKGEITVRLSAGEGEFALSVFNSGSYRWKAAGRGRASAWPWCMPLWRCRAGMSRWAAMNTAPPSPFCFPASLCPRTWIGTPLRHLPCRKRRLRKTFPCPTTWISPPIPMRPWCW